MFVFQPLARKENIVVQELAEELLVYDLNNNKALALNKTSAMVWQLCNGKNSVSDIAKQMTIESNNFVSEDFVLMSLEQLRKENLLISESVENNPFENLSRREMVRKVGFATVIALPIISSLMAPFAIQAASGCFPLTNNANQNPNGCPCDTLSDCISVCCSFANPRVCMPDKSGPLLIPVCQPCNANCQCPIDYNCPSILGRPRICRPIGVPVPALPAPDNCI